MTGPSHTYARARCYRAAAQRLREAVDLAGEAGATPDTVDAIQALAERMARAAEEIGGGLTPSHAGGRCGEAPS